MITAIVAASLVVVGLGVALFVFFRSRTVKPGGSVPKSPDSIGTATPLQTRGSSGVIDGGNSAMSSSNKGLRDRLKSRFVAIGVLIAGIFGTLSVKLWTMQVLANEQYVDAANENQYTTIKTPAARGRIFDTEGIVMVDNKTQPAILADADVAEDKTTMTRLSALLGLPYAVVRQRIKDTSGGAQAQREVSSSPRARDVAFISEHPDAFPGVDVQDRTHRVYPYKALASQVLGYTGTVSDAALSNPPAGVDYESGDEVGQAGVEAAYDGYLTGSHGDRVVVTDADGEVHEVKSETPSSQGNDVYLTISAKVQSIAEQKLKELIAPDGVIGGGTGTAGALVAMEVDTGNVIAMANFPTFNPENFVGGISQENWDRYNNSGSSYAPLMNRCIAGQYPAASTFKAFVGMAALHYGFADSSRSWNCSGEWTGFGEAYAQKCWLTTGHGALGLREAIVISCDTVFYEIAKDFYNASASLGQDAMQDYIKEFGLGSKTGIELTGEVDGVVPTPEWKKEYYRNAPEEGQWQPGDMTNMAIGQGNVLVTPLQMAVGYAGIATGSLPVPNLLKEVRNSLGETVISHKAKQGTIPDVEQAHLEVMRDALRGVATEDGDLPNLFSKYDYECACKTGTGEWAEHDGYAWFAMYAPYDNPKYVVTCVITEGGAGATAAAPIAAEVMDACIKLGDGALESAPVAIEEVTEITEYAGTGAGRVD